MTNFYTVCKKHGGQSAANFLQLLCAGGSRFTSGVLGPPAQDSEVPPVSSTPSWPFPAGSARFCRLSSQFCHQITLNQQTALYPGPTQFWGPALGQRCSSRCMVQGWVFPEGSAQVLEVGTKEPWPRGHTGRAPLSGSRRVGSQSTGSHGRGTSPMPARVPLPGQWEPTLSADRVWRG